MNSTVVVSRFFVRNPWMIRRIIGISETVERFFSKAVLILSKNFLDFWVECD